jgi:SAM-dependent methyltransferase
MADTGDETAVSAGISRSDEVDVQALFERLKDEVLARPAGGDGRASAARLTARAEGERLWPVAFDRPFEPKRGLRGRLVHPVKRLLRRLMVWYVEPFADEQRQFNAAALRIADELNALIDELRSALASVEPRLAQEATERTEGQAALEARVAELERARRLLSETEERVTRLERRRGTAPSAVSAPSPAAQVVPDYFAFESRMRGSTEEIRGRQEPYVEDFREAALVLDLGCGRGEFLGLLRDAGIEARGVDADADMVAFARGEGLEVEQADVVAALEREADGSLGGIFAAQLLEHLPPPVLLRLLELAAAKLRPGGLLAAETINPLSPLALRNYFADLTHAQPLVPETLELLARQVGFREVELRFLNEPPDERRLHDPGGNPILVRNAALLNDLLFGPLDYAILART